MPERDLSRKMSSRALPPEPKIKTRRQRYIESDGGEAAMLAGMSHGCDAYNEARGCSSYEPEKCGHHCDDSCPRCGG